MRSRRLFLQNSGWALLGAATLPSVIGTKKNSLVLGSLIPDELPYISNYRERIIQVLQASGYSVQNLSRKQVTSSFSNPYQALQSGDIDFLVSLPFHWQDLDPSFFLLSSTPISFSQSKKWLYQDNGLAQLRALYGEFDLHVELLGKSGPHIGHWHSRKIQDSNPYAQRQVNMFHLNAITATIMGGSHKFMSPSEAIKELHTGRLEAFEWGGPSIDHLFGIPSTGAYYYSSHWKDISNGPVLQFNLVSSKRTWSRLPTSHRKSIQQVAINAEKNLHLQWKQADLMALNKMKAQGVQFLKFPREFSARKNAIQQHLLMHSFTQSRHAEAIFRRMTSSHRTAS